MHVRVPGPLWILAVAIAALLTACQAVVQTDPRADENTIRNADIEWSKAAAAKDLEKILSYYAEDASVLAPNSPIATGKPSIRTTWTGMINLPGFSVNWAPSRVEVAKSGDLAWTSGVYNMMTTDSQGKATSDHGKYIEVWRKQPDGNWKVVADMFNSDMPVSAPQPSATPAAPMQPPK